MSRLFFAIALCLAMQAATAEAAPPGLPQAPAAAATATAVAAAGVVTASLSLPEKEAKGPQGASKTQPAAKSVAQHKDADDGDAHRPTTGAMLLAALVLMTGIALRRWGAGQ